MALKSKNASPSSQDASQNLENESVLEKKPNERVAVTLPHFEPLLDSAEAAALLKIHTKTLQKMARNREINGIQIGKLWRFRPSALNEWLSRKLVAYYSSFPNDLDTRGTRELICAQPSVSPQKERKK